MGTTVNATTNKISLLLQSTVEKRITLTAKKTVKSQSLPTQRVFVEQIVLKKNIFYTTLHCENKPQSPLFAKCDKVKMPVSSKNSQIKVCNITELYMQK